ncbi:hypothetical protein [Bradyrhizobium retamae]|uniref:Uncharacterized protein n=1 Tax=Bradyrhizobium retamae TaxID=1300035 RepID=A0A0R3NBL5_9BRAD|nr:hypothetical protein [Bradyrhizobium retamae]KRR29768.1 hypothetical protein CQ13_15600 [Bradyrhizobium retamae]
MLPGFRFLFIAIVLSMSILVFGLGAAALLRAAHEEFANLPSRRAAPEPMFARQNDDPLPSLALMRVDPPVAERPADNVAAAAVPEAASEAPASTVQSPDASPAEPEQLAAATPAEPEMIAETPVAPASAAQTEAPAPSAEVKLAAVPDTPEPAAAAASPPAAPTTDVPLLEDNAAVTRIATLGGPAAIVDEKTSAKTTEAKPDRSAVKKRAAQQAQERRRIAAQRARLAREAALAQQQLQANPFAQFQTPTPRATR